MEVDLTFNFSDIFTKNSNLSNTTESTLVQEASKWTKAEIARLIQIIFRPTLTITGTIGNDLTIYITRRSSLKYLSTCFYMFLLALADSIVLWSGCFGTWIVILTRDRVDPWTWTDCKLAYFLFYFGRHYSSMLLVLMSLEKCFAVYFPFKSKTVCTVKTAKWVTGVVGVILAGFASIFFFVIEAYKSSSIQYCVPSVDLRKIKFLFPVDSALYSFAPFVLMSITNFAIIFKFMRAKCKNNSTESTNQALVKAATRGTAMVVTVSVTFLLLTASTGINEALSPAIELETNPLYKVFMNFTQYLNHSINGVLYCVVGTKFRKEFLKIFCRKKISNTTSTSHSVTSISLIPISGSRA